MEKDQRNLEALVREAEALAKELCDGHVCLMRFTNHWKIVAGTPCLMPLWPDSDYLWALPGHPTLAEALKDFIKNRNVLPTSDGCY